MIAFPGKEILRTFHLERVRKRLKCLFVLSTGRVGTDAFSRVLALSSQLRSHHEPANQFLTETKKAYQSLVCEETLPFRVLNSRYFAHAHSTEMRTCDRNGLVYAETSNRLTYIAPALAEYLPNSRFIHLHRNPPDVIRSAMRREYYDNHCWDEYRITPRENDGFFPRWHSSQPFEKCCWYWRAVNEFALDVFEDLPAERRFTFSADAMFRRDFDSVLSLFEWLQVPPPDAGEIDEVLSVKHNAQVEGKFPKFCDWSPQQIETMQEIVGPIATRLGYSCGNEARRESRCPPN